MKVVVSGGGTGGHIYPALALIHHMQAADPAHEFLYIGTENGLESGIVPDAGIDFASVHITGFKRRISFDNVKTLWRFAAAVQKAKKLLKEFNPDVVVGTGGYVCGPVVYAASRLGIPSVIHEQNSVPGLTNKFLARYVQKTAVCFEEAASYFPDEKVVFTGNPRATEVVSADADENILASFGVTTELPIVLIVGGSRGARPINEAVLEAAPGWEGKPFHVLYVTGEVHYEDIRNRLKDQHLPDNVSVIPYVKDMPSLLQHVQAVTTRAGATTLAELTAVGMPSILIPSPYVTNNHQEKNADSLVNAGAAVMIRESELSGAVLTEQLEHLMKPDRRKTMQAAAEAAGTPDAAQRLYAELLKLAEK
ncbi:undecaprenyldiphospho-muramoylpentapeptide beta-N-acetylglucosaminyltransferase [Alkalicoccus chagannorensis]|uniref:undecaprenyldiphospho-muramoylpentapeptide beta-N-acetylglucosaminyltransferase n=1 Tax=Alkalicoccus chagannorensis TaxID=427072 RepID=UPI0004223D18|nr:undecaprenyldiphospho-muramoylpentapeptide beta-N-acetylglucosaminyltransferase [Alkalicoccus chagannorensis]